jgi:hypothetical protein
MARPATHARHLEITVPLSFTAWELLASKLPSLH